MAEKCIGGRFSLSVEGSRRLRRLLRLSAAISELSDEGDLRRRFGDLGGEALGALAFLGALGAGVGGGVGGVGGGVGVGAGGGVGVVGGGVGTGTAAGTGTAGTGGLGLFKLPLGRPAFRFSGRASIY